jgi:hypothetical protein
MQSNWRTTQAGKLILIGLILGASALLSGLVVRAAGVIGPLIAEEANGNRREIEVASPLTTQPKSSDPSGEMGAGDEPQQPTISFIDSPSATCTQPDSSRNTCYIEWNYLYVTASTSQYIISMTVNIDNRLRAYHSGFFQTYMYIPADLFGHGFKVACGPRGANGLGNAYAYTLRARETGGLGAANYGSIQCPGVYLVYAPLVRR